MSNESSELLELPFETRQPHCRSLVWQANELAAARYRANEMEQKLILYAVAMIDAHSTDFLHYRIEVAAYAQACGVKANDLYERLRAAAKSLATRPLLIEGHTAEDGKTVDLLTHWFSEVEFGYGYIDVTFPSGLKKYLLKVRGDFYKFELFVPLKFSGEHAIRLYQLMKRWKFLGFDKSITVTELRHILGLTELDAKKQIVRNKLLAYGDMRKWALAPAIREINRASDIFVGMKEVKEKGTKRVESIRFKIENNPAYRPDPSLPTLPPAPLAAGNDHSAAILAANLRMEFALSDLQSLRAVRNHTTAFIEEKAAIVRAKPRKNMAACFLKALREDWQPAKATPKKASAKVARAEEPQVPILPQNDGEKAMHEGIVAELQKRKAAKANGKQEKRQFVEATAEDRAAQARRSADFHAQLALIIANENNTTPPERWL